jgi:hypothetical protein
VTTDNYPNMRAKINAELTAIKEEMESGSLPWCRASVQKLIRPWRHVKVVDDVLEKLGADFYYDDVHRQSAGSVQHDPGGSSDSMSDDDEQPESPGKDAAEPTLVAVPGPPMLPPATTPDTAVAGFPDTAVEGLPDIAVAGLSGTSMEKAGINEEQAEHLHNARIQISALQRTMHELREAGACKAMQAVELELTKMRRRERALVKGCPRVADAFLQRRSAENEEWMHKHREIAELNRLESAKVVAIQARDAAIAEARKRKAEALDYENLRESLHAIKTFTAESLGKGRDDAGGSQGRKHRMEVLDRLARSKAGLSPSQLNDWNWFKHAWDEAMLKQHKKHWPEVFAGWMKALLISEKSNAVSLFVHNETQRVFGGVAALQVP